MSIAYLYREPERPDRVPSCLTAKAARKADQCHIWLMSLYAPWESPTKGHGTHTVHLVFPPFLSRFHRVSIPWAICDSVLLSDRRCRPKGFVV